MDIQFKQLDKITQILLECARLPDYKRKDYLMKEQKESGYSESVFFKDLSSKYKELFDYLNTREHPPVWDEDKSGNKIYFKNSITLRDSYNLVIRTIELEHIVPILTLLEEIKQQWFGDKPKDIFPADIKEQLIKFHAEFNNVLWEDIELTVFLYTFRTNAESKIQFKDGKKIYFNYAIWLIEEHRDKTLIPNFDNWYHKTIGGAYKNSRNPTSSSPDDVETKQKIKMIFR